jgi:hypothetical protein
LFRDLGFGFRIYVLKPRPVGGVLYFLPEFAQKLLVLFGIGEEAASDVP